MTWGVDRGEFRVLISWGCVRRKGDFREKKKEEEGQKGGGEVSERRLKRKKV